MLSSLHPYTIDIWINDHKLKVYSQKKLLNIIFWSYKMYRYRELNYDGFIEHIASKIAEVESK